jgi:pSer/pThr/pTyr-binding forkhead associated (FHA) protein
MARLLWEYQGQVIKDYPFPKGSVTIGRDRSNTIIFRNPEVSSSHARIDKVGADYILTDLQSTNGTFVNDLKVFSHRLAHGDTISIGKNLLLFIGTEKAKSEAERANIPLNQTVIIGGSRQKKRAPTPRANIERRYAEPAPQRPYFKGFLLGFLAVSVLGALGFFALKDTPLFVRGILPKALQGQKTDGTTPPPSVEAGRISRPSDVPQPIDSEGTKPSPLNEAKSNAIDTEGPSIGIDAIVWSSEAKSSFVLINGAEFRVGDSVEGRTITRIERDYVVFRSQEGEFTSRLKFK